MNRSQRSMREPRTRIRAQPPSLTADDCIRPVRAGLDTLIEILTDHMLLEIDSHFDEIRFRGQYNTKALRRAVRAAVTEKLMNIIREQPIESETEQEVMARLRFASTQRETSLKLLPLTPR